MKPLQIYSMIPPGSNASYYYRLTVPLETARDLGMPVKVIIDTCDPGISPQERFETFCESDIGMFYQPVGESQLQNLKAPAQLIPSKRDGAWKWPPSLVIETDDNIFNVSPLNPAYKGLGTRDMNGNELPDGHHIGIIENGQRTVKWADGRDGFSLARNRNLMNVYRQMLEIVDAVSCSNPDLEVVVKEECRPRRTAVFPNLVRFDHYEQLDLMPEPKKIKILWQGGHNHYEDWFPLRNALGNITERYPQVHWIICGVHYPWVTGLIPPERYTFHQWRPYGEYKLRRVMFGEDISLAPLSDNRFNRCRTAIKFYEASVLKKPAATLAQNVGPYKRELLDEETALLFNTPEEFESQLSRLIEDATLRQTLASNAKDWVSEHRDALKHVPKMVAFWESLREERKLEQPRVTDTMWEQIEKEVMEEEAKKNGEPVGVHA